MVKYSSKNYIDIEITKPINCTTRPKKISSLNVGDRIIYNNIYMVTDFKMNDDNILCVNEEGGSLLLQKDTLVTRIQGIKNAFSQLSRTVLDDVKNEGYKKFQEP